MGAEPHLRRKVAHADQHEVHDVGRGVHELQVVAGVPPAARGVDAPAERAQVAAEVAVAVDARRDVGHGVAVVQVCGRGAQLRPVEVAAVALGLVEAQRVGQRVAVDRRAAAHGEGRRDGAHRTADRDRVGAYGGQSVEVERVDVGVAAVPGAQVGADRGRSRDHRRAAAHREHGAGGGRARHEIGALGRRRHVAELIDAHEGGRRARRRGGWRRRRGGRRRRCGGRRERRRSDRCRRGSGRFAPTMRPRRSARRGPTLRRCSPRRRARDGQRRDRGHSGSRPPRSALGFLRILRIFIVPPLAMNLAAAADWSAPQPSHRS